MIHKYPNFHFQIKEKKVKLAKKNIYKTNPRYNNNKIYYKFKSALLGIILFGTFS